MGSTNTVPMFSPDGQLGDVPHDQVNAAAQKGFKVGQDMLSPDGQAGTIPLDNVHDALAKGFKLSGAPPKAPNPIPDDVNDLPGNEWRKDPTYEQHPDDPNIVGNTIKHGLGAAAAVGTMGASAYAPEGYEAAKTFLQSEAGKDLMKLMLKHTGEKLLTGAGVGVGYAAIAKAAKLLGLH